MNEKKRNFNGNHKTSIKRFFSSRFQANRKLKRTLTANAAHFTEKNFALRILFEHYLGKIKKKSKGRQNEIIKIY